VKRRYVWTTATRNKRGKKDDTLPGEICAKTNPAGQKGELGTSQREKTKTERRKIARGREEKGGRNCNLTNEVYHA